MPKNYLIILLCALAFLSISCSSKLGYGVLLWSIEDPLIESGAVLPVYVRSNIERKWVVGLPESESADKNYKFEISLSHLEFIGKKKDTIQRSLDFAPFAMLYAEIMQDRLPIREHPDNSSRQVYRSRIGEIIKILGIIEDGVTPIGQTGDPLEGIWYRVMTNDGVIGYCFSYRLNVFKINEQYYSPASEITLEDFTETFIETDTEDTQASLTDPPSQEGIRESRYETIYEHGSVYTSSNYGIITITQNGAFTWTGFELLVPHIIPYDASGSGLVSMDIEISQSLEEYYDGAIILQFNTARSYYNANFMYALDDQGLRLEVVPAYCIEYGTVTMRESTPMVLYFFLDSYSE